MKANRETKIVAMWRELPKESYWLLYTNDKSIKRKLMRGKKRKAEFVNEELNRDGTTFRLSYKNPRNAILGLKRLIRRHNYQEVRFDSLGEEFIAETAPRWTKIKNFIKPEVSK